MKQAEKKTASLLDGVPGDMPALAYCQAISHQAVRAGFEWEDLKGVLDKLAEEVAELESARTPDEKEAEMGDVFFSMVNVSRWMGIDAESALRKANHRFYRRFVHMEKLCQQRGLSLKDLSLAEKESLWQEAKKQERG